MSTRLGNQLSFQYPLANHDYRPGRRANVLRQRQNQLWRYTRVANGLLQ
jgi:hypothetical protein